MIRVATLADMADLALDCHGVWTFQRDDGRFLVSFETGDDIVVRVGDSVAEAVADVINAVRAEAVSQ